VKVIRQHKVVVLAVIGALLFIELAVSYNLIWPRVLSQLAIWSMPDVPAPVEGQKVLVLAPHPDDETIGAGGYIVQAIQAKARVRIVLVTDGNKRQNEGVRYAEFKKATGILGLTEADLVFLNLPDGSLSKQPPGVLSDMLNAQLTDFNPDIVIYPNSADHHPDHAAIGKTMRALIAAGPGQRIVYEYLVHFGLFYPRPHHFTPDLYLLPPVNLLTREKQWQCFMLSGEIEALKREAINSYKSQMDNVELKDLLLALVRRNELFAVPP
jgi:LmbE family N-acetylglucosaminyl deacetylase